MPIRQEKIRFFEKLLLDFFHKAGREHLPWRKKAVTAYEVWVSEVMLQQTQVTRVREYYSRFLARFPTVEILAQASWEEFLPYYQGLGYYARGRNMLHAAREVMERYQGKFPRDIQTLENLPGIGPYTARAILSFAYGEDHLAWDTNVRRVLGRFFFGGKQLVRDENKWSVRLQGPKDILNAALMDFGSAICTARPKCEACPLQIRCTYYRERGRKEMTQNNVLPTASRPQREKNTWHDAEAYVFLHENHRKYFSADRAHFRPFILPGIDNTRAGIQKHFQDKYGLTLSVRPPHQKIRLRNRQVLFVNAQILLGRPSFSVFSKNKVLEYTAKVLSKIRSPELFSS